MKKGILNNSRTFCHNETMIGGHKQDRRLRDAQEKSKKDGMRYASRFNTTPA